MQGPKERASAQTAPKRTAHPEAHLYFTKTDTSLGYSPSLSNLVLGELEKDTTDRPSVEYCVLAGPRRIVKLYDYPLACLKGSAREKCKTSKRGAGRNGCDAAPVG